MIKVTLRGCSGFVRVQILRRREAGKVRAERRAFLRLDAATVVTGLLIALVGCTTAGTPINGSGTTPPPEGYQFLTGNWVFQTSATSSVNPFTGLSGYINEQDQNPGTSDALTAALMAQAGSCYTGADSIPLDGTVANTAVTMRSFSVNGQYVSVKATSNAAANMLTGTYTVSGGCANGAAGTITGTRYAVLNGNYSGALTANSGQNVQISVQQNTDGTGAGNFFVAGTATFGGISCFTTGTMAAQNGSIIGNAVSLTFTTNDVNGSKAVLTGTIDPTAATLTLSSLAVTGGDCAGSLGGGTLALQ